MEKNDATLDVEEQRGDEFDDDGKPRRTGTVWTASAHIITAVIGSGVLSLGWAMAQLGWIAGIVSMFLFAAVTYYTSILLSDCYRTPDPVHGQRNYTYMAAVKANLGDFYYWLCGFFQYVNLFGTAVGYTITAAISAKAISKANCFHNRGHDADCKVSLEIFMVGFGVIQIFFSQVPNFHELWFLSSVAAVMSFVYSCIAIGLSIAKIVAKDIGTTTLTGIVVGADITHAGKAWAVLQALGCIAFAYSYSMIMIEIQDTLRSQPAENKVMKKATVVGVSTTTMFYLACGCLGYIAFGNNAPGNMLTDFGFFEPYWLVDFANFCIIVHLVGAYQVYSQPLFAVCEAWMLHKYPNVSLLTHESPIITSKYFCFNANTFRIVWRTFFVVITTLLAILVPFFNDILGFLGAMGFWPLTVFFPIEMYIARKKVQRFSGKWMVLQSLSMFCLIITLATAVASVEGIVQSLKAYRPFHTKT